MVYLSRIYTKTGDKGDTSLGDGSRVAKDHSRVAAYGSVDELNAVVGILRSVMQKGDAEDELLRQIQNDLFDVGADLCVPPASEEKPGKRLRVRPEQASRLENAIDRLNASLTPLTSFRIAGRCPRRCLVSFRTDGLPSRGTRRGNAGAHRNGQPGGRRLPESPVGPALRTRPRLQRKRKRRRALGPRSIPDSGGARHYEGQPLLPPMLSPA